MDSEIRRTLHAAADTVDASPPPLTALATSTARRRQAAEHAAAQRRTGRRTIAGQGRRAQLVAAAIVAVVLATGGGVLSNVLGQREAVTTGSGTAVQGSFRATVRYFETPAIPEITYDVVDGRVRAWTDTPQRVPAASYRSWDGFAETTPTLANEQIIVGDETYLHAWAGEQGQARWYRYINSQARWGPRSNSRPPRAGELTVPVFREGTRGFRRVENADAAARGLTRYSAPVSTADVSFLGWFAPVGESPMENSLEGEMDIWVDGEGRVRRVRWQEPGLPQLSMAIRFDQFDALGEIVLPSGEGDGLPVATDVYAVQAVGCGDPEFADALRENVEAQLDGTDIVESYEFHDRSSPQAARVDRRDFYEYLGDPGDVLFVVIARLEDDATDHDIGPLTARLGNFSGYEIYPQPDFEEKLSICSVKQEPYIKLHG
jgi:hypothetical protein